MNEKRPVKIQLKDGAIKEGEVVFTVAPPWRLVLSGLILPIQEFSGDDLFEALVALRLELEKTGARLLCDGARPDVFPSGMLRSMGSGRKAYITRIGASASGTDLVDIFEYAKPEAVGSVEQQKVFHERWVKSLRP